MSSNEEGQQNEKEGEKVDGKGAGGVCGFFLKGTLSYCTVGNFSFVVVVGIRV